MSEPTSFNTDASIIEKSNFYEVEYKKYAKKYQEIYEKTLIQRIEFESEIIIPDYFAFKYVEYTYETAKQFDIPPRVVFRLMFKESSFIDTAKSCVGAYGLMQLMPDTRRLYYNKLRIDTLNLDKNQQDIYIGLSYIKDLREFWRKRGNAEKNLLLLTIASYNAGPGKVIKHHGIPPYKETQNFVSFILRPHSNPLFYDNISKESIIDEIKILT